METGPGAWLDTERWQSQATEERPHGGEETAGLWRWEGSAQKSAHSIPSYRDDGRTLATDAGERVLGEAPDHTPRLTLQSGPLPGGGGGALRLKPLSYDRRAEARVTGLSPVVSDHVNSNKPCPR